MPAAGAAPGSAQRLPADEVAAGCRHDVRHGVRAAEDDDVTGVPETVPEPTTTGSAAIR